MGKWEDNSTRDGAYEFRIAQSFTGLSEKDFMEQEKILVSEALVNQPKLLEITLLYADNSLKKIAG